MDHNIPGPLFLSSRTIHQSHERIGKELNMIYSSSMGSMQAAVKMRIYSVSKVC